MGSAPSLIYEGTGYSTYRVSRSGGMFLGYFTFNISIFTIIRHNETSAG